MALANLTPKEQLINMANEFDYKMTQAQFALERCDKATTNRLQKELVELDLEIERRNKRFWKMKNHEKISDATEESEVRQTAAVETLGQGDTDTTKQQVDEIQEREEQSMENVDHGSTNWNSGPVEKRVELKTPQIISQCLAGPGCEELLALWLEMDSIRRAEIGELDPSTSEELLEEYHRNVAVHSPTSCACGDTCWVHITGQWTDRLNRDGVTEDEQIELERAKQMVLENRAFVSLIRLIIKCLQDRVDHGEVLDKIVEGCLEDILSLDKGKKRIYERREPDDSPNGFVFGRYRSIAWNLRCYCENVGDDKYENYKQIIEGARRLVNRIRREDIEKLEASRSPR